MIGAGGGSRSPRSGRRVGELPTVDRSPSRSYASGRGSPLSGRKRATRSGNNSPEHLSYGSSYHHHQLGSPYYSRDDELVSPVMMLDEQRVRSMSTGPGGHHGRSRSASRPMVGPSSMSARYTSLDRASVGLLDHDREFVPIRDPRERSRERSLYLQDDDLYVSRSARQSPNPHMLRDGSGYIGELQHQNNDLQRELGNLKKELELTNQKLGSSMHSIKTFWSPELKKERALRKEESTKYSLINEQLKLLNSENQVSRWTDRSLVKSASQCLLRSLPHVFSTPMSPIFSTYPPSLPTFLLTRQKLQSAPASIYNSNHSSKAGHTVDPFFHSFFLFQLIDNPARLSNSD